jgi:teichuronic acid biosynthesis glycosyltransferase TuaC
MWPTPAKPWFGSFVEEQVEQLRRLGLDVSVLPFDGTEDRLNYVRSLLQFRRELRRGRFDLVHAHYGLTGAIAVTQRRCPVVTTFHGGDYNGLIPWHALVSRVVARLCTPVVVTLEGVERLGVRNAAVIPAGVDCDRFRPGDRLEARRRLGLDPAAPYALLLGARADRNKRADVFDAAVAEARKTMPDLRSIALEGLDRAGAVAVMNAADVGVLTSDYEGLPVAVREALACETPVVAVPVGGVPELLRGLPGCAVVPRDATELGAAIVAAVGAGGSTALRERAEETSGAAVAKRLADLYADALRRHQRGGFATTMRAVGHDTTQARRGRGGTSG